MHSVILTATALVYCHILPAIAFRSCHAKSRANGFKRFLPTPYQMRTYNARSELRMGRSDEAGTMSDKLADIIFDVAVTRTKAHLNTLDKPALEWFEMFLTNLPVEDDDNLEENVLNKLIASESSLYKYQNSASTTELSMKFSYEIEPWLIADILLTVKQSIMTGEDVFLFLFHFLFYLC